MEFLNGELLQDAILRNIEIIGEASKRLDTNFQKSHPDFPVRAAIKMRNKVAHDYDMIDLEIVWDTIKEDIPFLIKICRSCIK